MINTNKAFHSSNLYEENLRSSKKPSNNQSSKNSISNKNFVKRTENSFGGVFTEPSPYNNYNNEDIIRFKGIPNSNPLQKPNKDINNLVDFIRPTENPAYFLKEKERVESQKKQRNSSLTARVPSVEAKNLIQTFNNEGNRYESSKNLIKTIENPQGLIQENNRLTIELNGIQDKIRNYENLEQELTNFQRENRLLKSELSTLNQKQQKETEFNEILKEFETNFRNKIMEVEAEKDHYKTLNKQLLSEKTEEKFENNEKIFVFQEKIKELELILAEKDKKINSFHLPPPTNTLSMKNSYNFKEFSEEIENLRVSLQEKTIETDVWKEKFYDLSGKEEVLKGEIYSLANQNKEFFEKMEILNRILEEKHLEKENIEVELSIYKKNLIKEKDDSELVKENMKRKIIEDEKRILNLINEFQKLNDECGRLENELREKDAVIIELKKGSSARSSVKGKGSELLAERNKENERTIKALEGQIETIRVQLENERTKTEFQDNELRVAKQEFMAKNRELEQCFNVINDQNATIKKLTEFGDFKQSLCIPKSENKLSYSFGEDENIEKSLNYQNNEKSTSFKKIEVMVNNLPIIETSGRLSSNRNYFIEENVKKNEYDNYSKPFKI